VLDNLNKSSGKIINLDTLTSGLFLNIKNLISESNYCQHSIEWINYYPSVHFSEEVNHIFGNFVRKENCVRSWISRIDPGKTAPWHWDIDDDEEQYLKKGKLVRFICKIGDSDPGHITVVGNNILHNNMSGDVYQWPDHRTWHGSANAGLIPKYQFNYLAYT
jgi:hypothetical protein